MFNWIMLYVHHVPGRLRVRVPAARSNPSLAQRIYRRVHGLPGVTSAAISLTTGSVLVHYDVAASSERAILDALGPFQAPAHPLTRRISSRMGAIVTKAVAGYLLETAVERATLALLAAVF